jgi:ribulose-phosphate 3-epimerase
MKPVRIAPSIIASDFSYLRGELARVDQSGADMLHVDIMDGHFVPNITFGPDIVKTMRKYTKLPFDVHLMISHPRQYITKFVEAGASHITFHIECEDKIHTALEEVIYYSKTVGLAVKPKTPLSAVQDHLGLIDRLLIMTVEPGFGGQKFMAGELPKVTALRARYPALNIEVDGGLAAGTIDAAAEAGANVIVAGSAVFGAKDPAEVIATLREAVDRRRGKL